MSQDNSVAMSVFEAEPTVFCMQGFDVNPLSVFIEPNSSY